MKQLFNRLKLRRKRRRKEKGIDSPCDYSIGDSPGRKDKKADAKKAPVAFVVFETEDVEKRHPPAYHDGDDNSDGYHRYDQDDGMDASQSTQQDEVVRMALHASQKALPVATKGSSPKFSSSDLLDKTAGECFEKGNIDDAVNKYEDALLLKRQTLLGQYNALKLSDASEEEKSRILASMATSINNLAYLRQVKGEASSAETLQSYEMALQIKREILGSRHLSVGKTLNNIGSVHYMQRNFYAAAENYEEARDILKVHLGQESLDVSTVSSNLGDVHYCLKQWKRASEEYRAALDLRWKVLGSRDPKVVRLMEQIADVEFKMSNYTTNAEVEECASDQGTFAAEVDQLHSELDLDIEFFSSLERDAPMTLIKDKAEVFKELRELSSDSRPEGSAISCESREPVSAELKTKPPLSCKTAFAEPQSPTRNNIPVVVGVRVLHQEESESSFPKTPTRKSRASSVSTSSESPQPYTPVERKEALESVRQRLARLRQEREQKRHSPSVADPKKLTSSKLLRASEILTIRQGLDSLRDCKAPQEDGVSAKITNLTGRNVAGPNPGYFLRP